MSAVLPPPIGKPVPADSFGGDLAKYWPGRNPRRFQPCLNGFHRADGTIAIVVATPYRFWSGESARVGRLRSPKILYVEAISSEPRNAPAKPRRSSARSQRLFMAVTFVGRRFAGLGGADGADAALPSVPADFAVRSRLTLAAGRSHPS